MSGSAGYLFDANVWLALAFAAQPHRAAAAAAFQAATAVRPACFCRATQQSVLRLLSSPAVLAAYGVTGLSNRDALDTLNKFMVSPAVAFREEPAGLVPL